MVFAVIMVFAIAFAIVAAVTVVLVTGFLMAPMTFMQPPALLFMVIVRMAPVGALKRRLGPMTRDPRVVAALRCPVSLGPYVAGARRIRLPFIAGGRRARPNIDFNLRRSRDHHRRF